MEIKLRKDSSAQISRLANWVMQINPEHMKELTEVLYESKDGITVTVEPLKHKHSREQENYYRKWCRKFGEWCGTTPNETHEAMLHEAYGSENVQTKLGLKKRPLKRSGDAEVSEYSVLIDTLIRVAAETGFEVPPPIKPVEG